MESREFNFKSLVDLLIARWKVFLIVAIIGAVVGVVISLPVFMTPKFKSVAVVYPVNTMTYSDESETEQLLQIFESSSVRDSIIEKFDLYKRYDIERGAPSSRFYILEEFNDRFTVSKTLYESVRLEVYDEDPELARAMADEMLYRVNEKFNLLANERGRNLAHSYKTQMDYQTTVIDSIEAMVSAISSEKGLVEYEAQSRELVRGYVESLKGGSDAFKDEVRKLMGNTSESGSSVMMLQKVSEGAVEKLTQIEERYLFWREYAFRDINYIDVVVSPETPDKKAWPVRWLIVVLSAGAALLLALVLVALGKAPKTEA
ncbi:MAG: Wzz/FepE/Etk N-terminal domain-containing protein [Cryomorphaceae bacterium]|nr:hypothetical protein [Flavobacteriales bacterium]